MTIGITLKLNYSNRSSDNLFKDKYILTIFYTNRKKLTLSLFTVPYYSQFLEGAVGISPLV